MSSGMRVAASITRTAASIGRARRNPSAPPKLRTGGPPHRSPPGPGPPGPRTRPRDRPHPRPHPRPEAAFLHATGSSASMLLSPLDFALSSLPPPGGEEGGGKLPK
jgi:hypothetical protein